MTDSCNLA